MPHLPGDIGQSELYGAERDAAVDTVHDKEDVTVWYDGACPLCTREIAFMQRLDTRSAIRFVDVSKGDVSGCPVAREDLLARFHASEQGRIYSGAEAFAAMWRAIPLLRPLGLAARFPPAMWLLERMYRVFLRVRPRLIGLIFR